MNSVVFPAILLFGKAVYTHIKYQDVPFLDPCYYNGVYFVLKLVNVSLII